MLTQALAKCIEAHGGMVRSKAEVKRICVRNGRADAVELASGDILSARAVVSNAHVKTTFLKLVGSELHSELRRRIQNINVGNGFGMVVRCAVHALPRYRLSDTENAEVLKGLQLLCPSTQYLHDAYADYLKGLPSEHPAVVAMTFSAVDATLAPHGKDTLFLWGQYYPYRLRDARSWDQLRVDEARKLFGVIDRFAPGASDQLIDMLIQSPKDIEEKHTMPSANVMHVEMALDQMFMFRPLPELSGYATPIRGLFLSSASMHPGGGIFGAAGYNCSHVVKYYLRKKLF